MKPKQVDYWNGYLFNKYLIGCEASYLNHYSFKDMLIDSKELGHIHHWNMCNQIFNWLTHMHTQPLMVMSICL